ncbi:hypothetical protein BH09BAC2_BH09BAC2_00950 [soil metagenome]
MTAANSALLSQQEEKEIPKPELLNIDYLNVKKAILILRSLNHKFRQQLVKLIDEHKRLTVTEIYIKLRIEQSMASQHLAILRKAGIVKTQRDGKFIYYAINYTRVQHIENCIKSFITT